jgi:NAD(P)-dependent dehydrogenase (short-subunit alcohol dehydrogenase family)
MRTVFIAGATGVVGRVLCKLLVEGDWRVHGMTRTDEGAQMLRSLGVTPVVMDVYERDRLIAHLRELKPAYVVHMLTDLPDQLDPQKMAQSLARNARIREEGTANLIDAAVAGGAQRVVAQSVAFIYAAAPPPYTEDSPLADSATAVRTLERLILQGPFQGLVLRYGRLYGPGTWHALPEPDAAVHFAAAADAARCALTRGIRGVYNIAEPGRYVDVTKAMSALQWDPKFRAAPLQPPSSDLLESGGDSASFLANLSIACSTIAGLVILAADKGLSLNVGVYTPPLLFLMGGITGIVALVAWKKSQRRLGLYRALIGIAASIAGCMAVVRYVQFLMHGVG